MPRVCTSISTSSNAAEQARAHAMKPCDPVCKISCRGAPDKKICAPNAKDITLSKHIRGPHGSVLAGARRHAVHKHWRAVNAGLRHLFPSFKKRSTEVSHTLRTRLVCAYEGALLLPGGRRGQGINGMRVQHCFPHQGLFVACGFCGLRNPGSAKTRSFPHVLSRLWRPLYITPTIVLDQAKVTASEQSATAGIAPPAAGMVLPRRCHVLHNLRKILLSPPPPYPCLAKLRMRPLGPPPCRKTSCHAPWLVQAISFSRCALSFASAVRHGRRSAVCGRCLPNALKKKNMIFVFRFPRAATSRFTWPASWLHGLAISTFVS